ncbi:MAG: proteasome-activating nucleotidase [Candidatus Helarchaeota archaeon]
MKPKKKSIGDDSDYLLSYSRHLERRIRALETEKQILEAEKIRFEREIRTLKSELDRMRQTPLVTAEILDILEDGRIIVKSSTGPNFVVNASSRIPKNQLKIGVRVSLNQRHFSIMELLPGELDPFVKGMEVETAPPISYSDIGGLEDQIRELKETVELPLKHPELFKKVGIEPPKGVLLCGPPGTGKTLTARAVAHETNATFIRVIASELVQKFIGEGARLVREIFQLAKEKAPTIVFIDELDAIGCKRLEVATSGDREVQRTLMQLLSTLDGFDSRGDVRILAATNRPDIIDPALLRPGRFDRIVEFPYPTPEARIQIFKIHTRLMNLAEDVDFDKLVKLTEGTSGADIKTICIEAGMFTIRDFREQVQMDDFVRAIEKVVGREESTESPERMYC